MELSTDTRVPPPSWINRDFIECALKNTERKKFIVDSMNVHYANPEGVGYASLMFRLTAFLRYENTEERQEKTLIVKTTLVSGELKDLIDNCDVFRTEGEMLHDVMPLIHAQLAALEGAEFRPLAATCYQCGRQPAAYLVLEDLSAAGFGLAQAGQPLDLAHCRIVLRTYARLHAASAYVVSRQPHLKDSFSFNVFSDQKGREFMGNMGRKLMRKLADELEKCPGYEQYSERYRAYADRFLDITGEAMEQIKKQTKLPVLVHGDCWKNNMMYKYMNGKVSEVRLVDFQASTVTSPASDLVYFLYANASEDVHRHHLEDLLGEYHGSLVGLLRALGMQQEAEGYSLQEFRKDMDVCLAVGVLFSTFSGFVLTSEKYGAEFAKALNDPKNLDDAVVKSFRNPYSLPYMKYLSPFFVSKGII